MTQTTGFLRRHSLVLGIILMYLLTWPVDLANSGVLPFRVPFALYVTLGYGFVFASLIMTWLTLGKAAVIGLLKRFLIWRVGVKWFLLALFLFPVLQVSAVLINAAFTRTPVDFGAVFAHKIFGASAALPLFVLPFLLFDAITNGEEIGWRGYVLPRLQAKHSALVSSLIVGAIWGFWHLPKYLAPGNTSPFGWFMVKVTVEAILYTWLYNNTKGSLLLTTLFHAAGNTGGAFLPIASTIAGTNLNTLLIQIALELLVAVAVTVSAGSAALSRTERKQVQE
ncbi:MAG TPA: type II CAAX endopeptidase family protein [Anaerolineales bacterium]|nr:type II CAAX endopeptidase family protein [Anaerolineales bacterium]